MNPGQDGTVTKGCGKVRLQTGQGRTHRPLGPPEGTGEP
jgi:hypothetical protein